MIKSLLNLLLVLVITNYLIFTYRIKEIEDKLHQFSLVVENNIDFLIEKNMYLVFDYENIELEISDIFKTDLVYFDKISETSFQVVIDIEIGFLHKKIQEKYFLEKGELYEGVN